MLVTYNREDCQVLKLLVDELARMQHSGGVLSSVHDANKHNQPVSEAGQHVHSQFKEILKFGILGMTTRRSVFDGSRMKQVSKIHQQYQDGTMTI
jgi:hypothetical protein